MTRHGRLRHIPTTLEELTGASAATFIAGKAVETEQPEITAITQHKSTAGNCLLQVRGKHLHQPVLGDVGAGAQFKDSKECVTVDGQEVLDVTFHGESGFDVTLKDERQSGQTLTVTLLGGVVLKDPQ